MRSLVLNRLSSINRSLLPSFSKVQITPFSSTKLTNSMPGFPYATTLDAAWVTPKKEGDRVPDVTFKTRTRIDSTAENPFDWKDVTTDDLFKGKKVIVFSLPGAFTPTCSNTHLPGYHAKYDEFKAMGIDDIYCLSVNDAFVMRQWGLHQGYVTIYIYS